MSDISIPGVKSKYDTEKLIEGLMKIERIPMTRAEEQLKQIQLKKTTWLDLNRRLTALRESSRSMFSFQNPFNDRIATSSDESVLTATATREALEETRSFDVKRTAAADRFMSDPVNADAKVPAGSYTFTVGESSVKLSYGGGSIKDFVDAINRKGGDTVRAEVVAVTSDSRVLVVESLKTGSKNRLAFSDAAEPWALSVGLVEKASSSRRDLSLSDTSRFEQALDPSKVVTKDGVLMVGSQAEAALRLRTAVPTTGLVLEVELELADRTAPVASDGPPPGPTIPSTGVMEYEGIRITSEPSAAALPEWTPPPAPVKRDDFSPLYIIDGAGRSIALPAVAAGAGYKTVTIPLPAYADSFAGLGLRNGNTDRDLRIKSARVFDPTETAGMRPRNPVQTARDAVIAMDGIEVTRPSNAISDLVPGLTLNLWQASDKPVKLKVEPDRKAAKDSLIELVGNYNRLMAELNILARPDAKILEEITYFTEDEKKTYKERAGLMQGDSSLSQLRTSLQRTIMDPYQTRDGDMILGSAGISTDSRRGGSYDSSRMRGYLEIDETALDKALKENFQQVKDMMGYDTDGDLIVNSGVAFKLDALMKAYVETGGIVSTRTSTLDSQMTEQKKQIDSLETQLARKEADLKRKYGLMESSLNQMEQSSSAWDSFGKQGN
jgi:flagellar hook-associated protein 2